MQYKLNESITLVIDSLATLSYFPDLLELCIKELNKQHTELPGYVFWILDAIRADLESQTKDALHRMEYLKTSMDEYVSECPVQTPEACFLMRYAFEQHYRPAGGQKKDE